MRHAPIGLVASVSVALLLLSPHTTLAANKAEPGSCNIATPGIEFGSNTVACNFGLTLEQLEQVTEAAVKGATEPPPTRILT
jgi:hypothetical protein